MKTKHRPKLKKHHKGIVKYTSGPKSTLSNSIRNAGKKITSLPAQCVKIQTNKYRQLLEMQHSQHEILNGSQATMIVGHLRLLE